MNENFLENFCLIPTRGSNILDLILSNDPGQIYTVVSKGISDHNLLEINIEHPYTRPTESGSREVPKNKIPKNIRLLMRQIRESRTTGSEQ